jgi:Xaa-Pro aminopeptidase
VEDLVERFRQIKSAEEIALTRQALALAETAFRSVVENLKPGMTEKQVAWAMESAMRQSGADGLSFPVIVAGGPNSALPHAVPSERPIRTGEPILFDWGAKLNGYCSDTSRTIILGAADDTFKKVHGTVLEAQQRAIAAIRPAPTARRSMPRRGTSSIKAGMKANSDMDSVMAPAWRCMKHPGSAH